MRSIELQDVESKKENSILKNDQGTDYDLLSDTSLYNIEKQRRCINNLIKF